MAGTMNAIARSAITLVTNNVTRATLSQLEGTVEYPTYAYQRSQQVTLLMWLTLSDPTTRYRPPVPRRELS